MSGPSLRESRRLQAVQSPVIPLIAAWLRATPGAISLGQGVVAYGPPPAALAAARAYGDVPDEHRYGPVTGDPELIAAWHDKLARDNGMVIGDDRCVTVTAGANMGFLTALLAVADPGDEIIMPAPYYFNYEMAVTMAGCRTVAVPTGDDWQLSLDDVAAAITPHTRAVVTISPNNPTGAVYPMATLRAVNELCRARGLWHISDEAYEYFVYDGAGHYSPGSGPNAAAHTIALFSLSKAYGFAAWRIGAMVAPRALAGAIGKIQDTNLICPTRIAQRAAAAALTVGREYCLPQLATLARVRAMVHDRLQAVADICRFARTAGAFYVWLEVRTQQDALALAEQLVREYGVAVVPGAAFGVTTGCSLRLSYGAPDEATVAEGIDRLVRGLRALA
ncbi:MAG TPA: pyridoxal phosphate-dependent aminotransferase [bacterium]|nr:pyridoxal phosphate-dependent aminotransferase [bacterium]